MTNVISAHAFIDWDSARRIRHPPWGASDIHVKLKDRALHAEQCFSDLQLKTAEAIERVGIAAPIRIQLSRIYHGWHRGATATDDRRAWEQIRGKLRPVVTKRVSFLPDVRFGNDLACGGWRCPLLDTLRRRDDGRDEQKMVDTALVSDLLSYSRSESSNFRRGKTPSSMAIVIADDDDLLPGSFVAERWGLPVRVLRMNRDHESRFLNLSDLVFSL